MSKSLAEGDLSHQTAQHGAKPAAKSDRSQTPLHHSTHSLGRPESAGRSEARSDHRSERTTETTETTNTIGTAHTTDVLLPAPKQDDATFSQSVYNISAPPIGHAGHVRETDDEEDERDSQEEDEREQYPEGGVRAWLVVFGCWLALFVAFGQMNMLANLHKFLPSNRLVIPDDAAAAGIIVLNSFLAFALGICVGPLFDYYGPRWLVAGGSVCLVASLLIVSVGTRYWHFLVAFGILSALSTSLLLTPSIAAIGHFFERRRGLATGVAMTAGSASGIFFPLVFEGLFVKFGWVWAMRTLAIASLPIIFAANFLIRSRLPPARDEGPYPDFGLFRNMDYTCTVFAIFVVQLANFIPLTFMSAYALSEGISLRSSFEIITTINASSVVGRVVGGWWSDSIGTFNTNVICSLITFLICVGVWLPVGFTLPGIFSFAVIFGFTSGTTTSLVPVTIGKLGLTQTYGRYYGTCYSVVSLATLVALPIASSIVSSNNEEYWGLIVLTGMLYLIAAAAFLFAKSQIVGWKLWLIV